MKNDETRHLSIIDSTYTKKETLKKLSTYRNNLHRLSMDHRNKGEILYKIILATSRINSTLDPLTPTGIKEQLLFVRNFARSNGVNLEQQK